MPTQDFADAFTDALVGLLRMIRHQVRRSMPVPPMRGAQIELLRLVVTRPGIGESAAAKELYLAGNSVSTLVNQLSKAGYLVRETDPADRRSVLLRPTPAATARLQDWQARRSALVREQVARLSAADQAAIAAAVPALERLARNLHGDLHEQGEAP